MNLLIVSFNDSLLAPPAAFVCPPPLKCSLDNSFTEKSPFDRNDILIKPLVWSSLKIAANFIPLSDKA
jgi:hypothetical protein